MYIDVIFIFILKYIYQIINYILYFSFIIAVSLQMNSSVFIDRFNVVQELYCYYRWATTYKFDGVTLFRVWKNRTWMVVHRMESIRNVVVLDDLWIREICQSLIPILFQDWRGIERGWNKRTAIYQSC